MAVSRNLYLALLSIDVYNRDYDTVVTVEGDMIGDVSVIDPASYDPFGSLLYDWQSTGFYALAYDTSAVDTIVDPYVFSYRGTNPSPGEDFLTSPIWLDASNGWTAAVGFPGGDGGQASQAVDFYSIVLADLDADGGEVTITGHSLGGGLAGLVANVFGEEALLFDHMPYEYASQALYDWAVSEQYARDRFFDGTFPGALDDSDIEALSTEGEFLSAVRLASGDPEVMNLTNDAPFSDDAWAADARSHDAVVAFVRAAASARNGDPAKVGAALRTMAFGPADGLAGPALDFSRPTALTAEAIPVYASQQDLGLRPQNEDAPRLVWVPTPANP